MDDAACIASNYSDMAAAHATITRGQRRELGNAPVRFVNNFVKACAIDAAARALAHVVPSCCETGIDVLEVAGGRGQDHAKWRHGCAAAGVPLRSLTGIDLVEANTDAARSMAAKQLPRSSRAVFVSLDAGDGSLGPWPVDDQSVDVVSMQLALHYFCDSEQRMAHVFTQAARCLRPHGLLMVSYTDGRAVVRLGREALAAVHSRGHDDGDVDVVVRSRHFELTVPKAHLAPWLPSVWGRRYTFAMPGSVCAPEYLCHEGAIVKFVLPTLPQILHVGTSTAFDAAAVCWRHNARLLGIARLMATCESDLQWLTELDTDTLAAVGLYRLTLYAPQAQVLKAWSAALAMCS